MGAAFLLPGLVNGYGKIERRLEGIEGPTTPTGGAIDEDRGGVATRRVMRVAVRGCPKRSGQPLEESAHSTSSHVGARRRAGSRNKPPLEIARRMAAKGRIGGGRSSGETDEE